MPTSYDHRHFGKRREREYEMQRRLHFFHAKQVGTLVMDCYYLATEVRAARFSGGPISDLLNILHF